MVNTSISWEREMGRLGQVGLGMRDQVARGRGDRVEGQSEGEKSELRDI